MKNKDLRDCPFCGGLSKISKTSRYMSKDGTKILTRVYRVYCKFCFSSTGFKRTKKEAIESWQRRDGTHYYHKRSATKSKDGKLRLSIF